MSLQEQFNQAVADSKTLTQRPDNLTLLKIYALYKQATKGNVDGEQPVMTDFVARAKWDAWNQLENVSMDDAKQQYIDLIDSLKG